MGPERVGSGTFRSPDITAPKMGGESHDTVANKEQVKVDAHPLPPAKVAEELKKTGEAGQNAGEIKLRDKIKGHIESFQMLAMMGGKGADYSKLAGEVKKSIAQTLLGKIKSAMTTKTGNSVDTQKADKTSSVASPSQARLEKVKAYLQTQKVVRINVPNAPGLGHQAASVSVSEQLRSLGYKGVIEFICDDRSAPAGQAPSNKLQSLLPGFVAGGDKIQDIPESNIRVVVLKQGDPDLKTEVGLGIYGAHDDPMTHDLHGPVNAKNVIVLQPHQWHQPRMVSTKRIVSLPGQSATKKLGLDSLSNNYMKERHKANTAKETDALADTLKRSHMTYQVDLSPPSDLNALVTDQYELSASKLEQQALGMPEKAEELNKKAADLRTRGETVNALFNEVKSGKVDMMMTYGIDFAPGLPVLAGGIRHAQNNGEAKGTVMLITGGCKDEALKDLPENSVVVEGNNPNAAEMIKNLEPGKILVLRLGGAPKPIFTELIRAGTMPGVYEGANTTMVGKLMGKPSMTWDSYKTPFIESDGYSEVTAQLRAVEQCLVGKGSAETVGNYIIGAMKPDSPVNRYFQAERDLFLQPENNSLVMGLDKLC